MPFLILLGVVVVLALWVMGAYNRLIGLRNQTQNGWKQIDVQLKRRHDLIPNLVNTVKGAMDFEKGTLTAVMEARNKAMAAAGPAAAIALLRASITAVKVPFSKSIAPLTVFTRLGMRSCRRLSCTSICRQPLST